MRVIPALAPALASALAALLLAGPSLAEAPGRTIIVSGEAQVAAAPDMATISLGVTTQGQTARAALDANSAALAAVLDRLESSGVAAKDIQTSGLSLNPQFDYRDSSQQTNTITGYVASNMVTVAVRRLDSLGTTLDAVVSDGANTLNGVSFGLQDPQPALDSARRKAVEEAARRAALYAAAAGVALGPVLTISESGGGMPPMPMAAAAYEKAGSVPVASGEVAVSASVSITYRIAD